MNTPRVGRKASTPLQEAVQLLSDTTSVSAGGGDMAFLIGELKRGRSYVKEGGFDPAPT